MHMIPYFLYLFYVGAVIVFCILVLRRETERPEAVAAGTVRLCGVERGDILAAARQLLTDSAAYNKMARAVNPYGDGTACKRIAECILYGFGRTKKRPGDFHVK